MLYPSDEFGGQELPSKDIPGFVTSKGLPIDGGGCTLMAKVQTNGASADPVWRACKEATSAEPVRWNFAAWFLIDTHGNVVGRYSGRDLKACGDLLARLVA